MMIYKKLIFLFVALAAVFGGTFLFFRENLQKEIPNGTIHVVTSFYPLSYIAKTIGSNLVTVSTVVHTGVEPHDFEPSPRDLVEIGNADIFIYNGASLEPWIKKWEQSASVRPKYVINMADALTEKGVLLIKKNGSIDPHFWLDPLVMKTESEIVRDALAEVSPVHRDLWGENANHLFVALDSLDRRFHDGLSACSFRDIVVLHDAFSYLARRYDISATAIEGISPDEEPSPKELARITDLVRAKGVKYIFFETIASPKFSELIAREVGGATLVLNPVESLTPNEVQLGEDYISVMEKNLSNLRKAMLCN